MSAFEHPIFPIYTSLIYPRKHSSLTENNNPIQLRNNEKGRKFGLILICLILFCDVMSGNMCNAILPDLLKQFFNHGNSCTSEEDSDSPECKSAANKVQFYQAIFNSLNFFFAFLGAPIAGSISDSYGRRRSLIVSQILSQLPFTFICLYLSTGLSLWFYFVFNCFTQIFDCSSLGLAYCSDLMDPEHRGQMFGIYFSLAGLSLIIGPFLGSIMPSPAVYYITFSVSAISLIIVIFIIPESLIPANRSTFQTRLLNPWNSLRILFRYRMFIYMAACVFFGFFGFQGCLNSFYLIYQNHLDNSDDINAVWIGKLWICFGIVAVFSQTLLLRIFTHYCKFTMRTVLLIGTIALTIAFPLYAIVTASWQVYFIMAMMALGSLQFPSIAALKSNFVDSAEQGQIQGALYGVRALGSGCGPLLMGVLASDLDGSEGRKGFWQLPFLVAAVAGVISLILALWIKPPAGERLSADIAPLDEQLLTNNEKDFNSQQSDDPEMAIEKDNFNRVISTSLPLIPTGNTIEAEYYTTTDNSNGIVPHSIN